MHQQFLLLSWTCKLVKNVENKNVQSYSCFVFYKNTIYLNGFRNYRSLTLLYLFNIFVGIS